MAEFIPSNNLERNYLIEIINKETNKTIDWKIFHSFPKDNKLKLQKNDLLIITPTQGIYLIRVVEGGIRIKNGKCDDDSSAVNPFVDIEKEMYDFRNFYNKKNLKETVIGYGVAFVDLEDKYESIEVDKKIIFTIKNDSFVNYINTLFNISFNRIFSKYKSKPQYSKFVLSKNEFSHITNVIKKELNIIDSCKELGKTFELTTEQRELLTVLENEEDRAIVHGAAGTGKTELALHVAMDMHKQDYKTIFFTNNVGAARKASEFIAIYGKDCENLECEPFQEFLIKLCKKAKLLPENEDPYHYPKEKKNEFYNYQLRKLTLIALDVLKPNYEVIVIDQAQDLTQPNYLMIISLLLKKRMNRGRWYFFGDFLNQLLFRRSVYEDKILQYLDALSCDERICNKEFTYNCRSSVAIVNELNKLTGMKVLAKNVDRAGKMQYIPTINDDDYVKNLDVLLDELIINRKINPSEITIIGTRKIVDSSINSTKYRNMIYDGECDEKSNSKGKIIHTRLFLYKGLENNYVIIYDLNGDKKMDDTKQGEAKTSYRITMLYTGISRGRNEVYVLENEYDLNLRNKCYYAVEMNKKEN